MRSVLDFFSIYQLHNTQGLAQNVNFISLFTYQLDN